MTKLRTCTACGVTEPDCGFYRKGDGFASRCRDCIRDRQRKPRTCLGCGDTYYRIGSAGSRRRLCDSCALVGKVCARCGAFKPLDSFYGLPTAMGGNRYCKDGCALAVNRENRYGITRAQHDDLAAAATGACPICGKSGRRMVLDHDHTSGAPREIICGKCNSGLGLFDDSVTALLAAAAYLAAHSPSGVK